MAPKDRDRWLHIQQIVHYAKTSTFMPSVTKERKSGIRKAASKIVFDGDHAYYCGSQPLVIGDRLPDDKKLIVTSYDEMKKIMREAHDNSGHLGIKRTVSKITKQYHWLSMVEDVCEWVQSCEICQFKARRRRRLEMPSPRPIKVKDRWEILNFDLIGPFNLRLQENQYIVKMMDLFSKWLVAYPLVDKSVLGVTQAIVKMIYAYGLPMRIIADQDRDFISEVNKNIMSHFNKKDLMTASFCIQLSDEEKRMDQDINAAIIKCCSDNPENWDEVLPSIVYNLNTNQQKSMMCTPFYLMFFRHTKKYIGQNSIEFADNMKSEDNGSSYQIVTNDIVEQSTTEEECTQSNQPKNFTNGEESINLETVYENQELSETNSTLPPKFIFRFQTLPTDQLKTKRVNSEELGKVEKRRRSEPSLILPKAPFLIIKSGARTPNVEIQKIEVEETPQDQFESHTVNEEVSDEPCKL